MYGGGESNTLNGALGPHVGLWNRANGPQRDGAVWRCCNCYEIMHRHRYDSIVSESEWVCPC